MAGVKAANLGLKFLLELVAVAPVAYLGASHSPGLLAVVLAIAIPAAVLAPRGRRHGPRRPAQGRPRGRRGRRGARPAPAAGEAPGRGAAPAPPPPACAAPPGGVPADPRLQGPVESDSACCPMTPFETTPPPS